MRSRRSLVALLRHGPRHRSSTTSLPAHLAASHRAVHTSTPSPTALPPPPHPREVAWRFFAAASRELRTAAHQRRAPTHAPPPSATPSATSTTAAMGQVDCHVSSDAFADGTEYEDVALAAATPPIAQQTSAAASNATLMRELGVLDRAELLHHEPQRNARNSSNTAPQEEAAAALEKPSMRPDPSMQWATAYMLRVCQTGAQAQVSSFVILRHLWAALYDAPTAHLHAAAPSDVNAHASAVAGGAAAAPTAEWAARLPAAVRLVLLQDELARVQRRRRYAVRGVQGEAAAPATDSDDTVPLGDEDQHTPTPVVQLSRPDAAARTVVDPVEALSSMWTATVLESRAVVRCCCVAWWPSATAPSQRQSTQVGPLLDAQERQVLEAAVRVCAVAQLEDVAQAMMEAFLRRVAAVTSDAQRGDVAQAEEDFAAWYTAEADALYESAMTAAGAPRTHAPLRDGHADATSAARAGGFPLAYSYLVHRGSTLARLGALSASADDATASAEMRASGSGISHGNSSGGWSWKDALQQRPPHAMQLLAALAGSVDANAEHFEVVLQLYRSMLAETDAGYATECVDATRRAFCAVVDALARVPLPVRSYETILDDIYRSTLVQSSQEVTHHPDVLASCLRVCSAARLSPRALTLFNKLAEPASHAVAAEERNVAAMLLSTAGPASATLQRLLSLLHTKLPVTADVVHAAAARMLLSPDDALAASSSPSVVFAMFDVLELTVAAQHHATVSTAAAFAQRTFFLRIVALLAGVHAELRSGALSAAIATEAAAAMMRQWVRAAAAGRRGDAGRGGGGLPALRPLPPVALGVLQELALQLRRATVHGAWQCEGRESAGDSTSSSSSSEAAAPALLSGTAQVPLLAVVEGLLRDAAACMPKAVTAVDKLPDTNTDSAEGAVQLVLYTAPASLQWRRTREVWPLAEQQRFTTAVRKTLASHGATPAAGAVTRCVGFQDWVTLAALERHCNAADALDDLASVWTEAKSGAKRRGDAGHHSAAAAAPMCVLTPLAEVEWWCRHAAPRGTPSAASSQDKHAVALTDAIGVSVPPAVGCPTHTWHHELAFSSLSLSAAVCGVGNAAELVRYWLQRWLDEVEDARLLPRRGVFHVRVAQALQQRVTATAVRSGALAEDSSEATDDAAVESTAQSGGPVSTRGTAPTGGTAGYARSAEATAPARREPRSGLETVLVRGPTSLVYGG